MAAAGLLLGGCWDVNSLETLGYVNMITVGYQHGQYQVSLQVLNPGNIPLAAGGQGSSGPPVWVGQDRDSTIVGAVERVSERYPKKLFWGQLDNVIVSPAVAQSHMLSVLEFLDRQPHARIIAWLFVASKPGVIQLTTVAPPEEPFPGQALTALGDVTQEKYGIFPMRVNEFLRALPGYGHEPLTAAIDAVQAVTPPQAQDYRVASMALFRGTKMVGWSSPRGTMAILALRGAIHFERLILPRDKLAVRIVSSTSQLRVIRHNGNPVALEARVKLQIALIGTENPVNTDDPNFANWLTHQVNLDFNHMIRIGVRECQRSGTDVPGFGEAFREEDEKAWMAIAPRWDTEIFPKLPLRVVVESTLVGLGQSIKGSY